MSSVAKTVADRLSRDGLDAQASQLVLAGFGGVEVLERHLEDGLFEQDAGVEEAAAPLGAYVTSITVEGFRGIGPPSTLQLTPGPGLTLVVGRNGSGKSSFAEALEVLFTGDNQRWANRSAVWREGWRNLHHPIAAIEATLGVESAAGATVIRREWADGAALDASSVEVQPHGAKKTDLSFLGWEDALVTHRPFLSYSELGSMLDEGPTKLHDAVSSVLGLEELPAAEKALKDARLARERRQRGVLQQRDQIIELLDGLDDERARTVAAAIRPTQMNLDAVEEVVTEPSAGDSAGDLAVLNRLCAYSFPTAEEVEAAAAELRASQSELADLAGTHVDRLLRGAELLEQALSFRADFGETTCPVCATPGVLTDEWASAAEEQAHEHAAAADEARRARARYDVALRRAGGLLETVPAAIREAREIVDVSPVIEAWADWVALTDVDARTLADRLERTAEKTRQAVRGVQEAAQAEVERRQDAWRPVALHLAAWLSEAQAAQRGAAAVAELRRAEAWLKREAVAIRNERFAPIADEAGELWRLLRQRSNVVLGRVELAGAGVARRVVLDVTVDGVAGAALGVMSQGELHALALSLFFPRATLDESPFRFIVVDDPVQSMDPAKVDGLAKVLERAAGKRQVIVFTHDDRLPEAIRRLGIEATIIEVVRAEKSVVELRPALTPVERYIEDARAVVLSADLPDEVARRVVGGFCRFAVEAACIDAVRRRRIGRGEAHGDVERLLERVTKLGPRVALALFDDDTKAGNVLTTLNNRFGRRAADVFVAINRGAHEPVSGDLRDLTRDSAVLARELADAA